MELQKIQELWNVDSDINENRLSDESLKIPKLHAKYRKILSYENLLFVKYDMEFKKLFKAKYEHYLGTIDTDELIERNWEPIQLKILKTDVNMYLDSDEDLQELKMKLSFQKEKINFLESILQTINSRSYHINNAIEFMKFINGR